MVFEGVINHLSIGNVSYNFLRELYKLETDGTIKLNGFFPIFENFDLSSFNAPTHLHDWLVYLKDNALKNLKKDDPALTCWHILGSERKLTTRNFLYTFYETDEPTQEEIAVVNSHTATIFSSSESASYFQKAGCENVFSAPLGFDEDFASQLDINRNVTDVTHFGLVGKFERRKNTQRIIRLWAKKYGNNNKYLLSCLVNNPFFRPELYDQIIKETLGPNPPFNINFIPALKTNREVIMFQQAVDVDLSGLSNGEGWGLPAFNSTCLGKWSVVSNCSGHKDWATKENCVLVETSGKQPCYDGAFFIKGSPNNQGNYHLITDEALIDGMERAEKLSKIPNKAGIETGVKMSYKESVKQILQVINSFPK